MKEILAIYRSERFSPNSVEKDRDIMDCVGTLLAKQGHNIKYVREELLAETHTADIILTMGRMTDTLKKLKRKECEGAVVINSPDGIKSCARSSVDRIMRANDIPAAPLTGSDGYWLKRGDEAAQSHEDVVFASNKNECELMLTAMKSRGIGDIVVTAHVNGDIVKFYGVLGTGFFRTYYPTDDGISKFGDERHNGKAHHYPYAVCRLQQDAEKLAQLTGICVYGGDCIIREDGSYAIIDFNDWPSFSRCKKEASEAICRHIISRLNEQDKQ